MMSTMLKHVVTPVCGWICVKRSLGKMKPIKIKKKMKACWNCIHIKSDVCSLAPEEKIPARVVNSGCDCYKKNKHVYF